VTEPETGLGTTKLKTRAIRQGDRYTVNGRKIWCSTAQVADKIMLLARTADYDAGNPTGGLSLFYTDLDRKYVEIREIPKMGRAAVDTNFVFYDGLPVPKEDLIGEEGRGFYYLLDGINPERCLVASEAIGIGQFSLDRAAEQAPNRDLLRSAHRAEPRHSAPAGCDLGQARRDSAAGLQSCLALRHRRELRSGGERRKISGC